MEHGLKSKIAVIGGGPAGCMCAYFLQQKCDVTVFEANSPLKTLLPTGGGRCNLAHCEYDFKELATNYPRGEKFLYSVFSKFATCETLEFFKNIGVETYVQEDMRIFPVSNSSKDVREKFLTALNKVHFKKEKVLRINPENVVVTDSASYKFDGVVVATGGHASYNICKYLGHKIITPKKALVGLVTKEDFSRLAGVTVKVNGEDLLFTHQGISGPWTYKLSSIRARDNFPYKISVDLSPEIDFQSVLNSNPHKAIRNLLAEFMPKSLATYVLDTTGVNADKKSHEINGNERDCILQYLKNFEITVVAPAAGGEVVTCGGVSLDEVNAKTMESKLVSGLYFCGEVLDIDGFCGGFNLQNCWSTAYVAAQAIIGNGSTK